MYVVDGICSIKIYIHPGKFKMPTENLFINLREFLNGKVLDEHVKAYINIGNKKEKGKFIEKLMTDFKLDDDVKKLFYLKEINHLTERKKEDVKTICMI